MLAVMLASYAVLGGVVWAGGNVRIAHRATSLTVGRMMGSLRGRLVRSADLWRAAVAEVGPQRDGPEVEGVDHVDGDPAQRRLFSGAWGLLPRVATHMMTIIDRQPRRTTIQGDEDGGEARNADRD